MFLWHDDEREAPKGWTLSKSNTEAQEHLSTGAVAILSMDHDLGDGEPEGIDLARWMVENDCVPPSVYVHSWNPSGGKSIVHCLEGKCSQAGPLFVPFSTLYKQLCEQEAAK